MKKEDWKFCKDCKWFLNELTLTSLTQPGNKLYFKVYHKVCTFDYTEKNLSTNIITNEPLQLNFNSAAESRNLSEYCGLKAKRFESKTNED